jgi:hypothetical protein
VSLGRRNMREKEYYSAEEFGDIFEMSYRSILVAIKNGRIRAFKVGLGNRNPYRIPHSEIIRIEISGMREINPELNLEQTT